MKKILLNSFLAIASLFCLSATAYSENAEIPRVQKPDPRAASKAKLIARYDKNNNGKLDPEEIKMIARDRMLENDHNKDGRVDQSELKRPRAGVRKMPPMDALQRAMAREEALSDARIQLEKERLKNSEKPVEGNAQ